MNNKVLAQVGDYKVTEQDVIQFIQLLGPEGANFHSEEGIKQVATELVNQHLIYLDAKESNLDEDEEFQKELEIAREQILKQYSMKRILDKVEVSDEEAKEFFEKNKELFKPVYSFKASHILVDNEEDAKEIKAKIDKGEKFEDLASGHSSCPSKENGGQLGVFSTGEMDPQFENACYEMEIGTISEPVHTQFGYHIIKLEDKAKAKDTDFESVKSEIRNILLGQKQQEKYLEVTSNLQNKYKVETFF